MGVFNGSLASGGIPSRPLGSSPWTSFMRKDTGLKNFQESDHVRFLLISEGLAEVVSAVQDEVRALAGRHQGRSSLLLEHLQTIRIAQSVKPGQLVLGSRGIILQRYAARLFRRTFLLICRAERPEHVAQPAKRSQAAVYRGFGIEVH